MKQTYEWSLLGNAKSWFTGYNSNVDGHDKVRYMIYNGGALRYRKCLAEVAEIDYRGFDLRQGPVLPAACALPPIDDLAVAINDVVDFVLGGGGTGMVGQYTQALTNVRPVPQTH